MARFCVLEKNQINVEKCNSCNEPNCGYNISKKVTDDSKKKDYEENSERSK